MNMLVALLLIPLTLLVGCAESSALIKQTATGTRNDVFVEEINGGAVPQGFVDLHVTGSFKTHRAGLYSATDPHGTPGYQLQLDVDGQTVLLSGELQAEKLSAKEMGDPETGAGIRYRFRKVVRLKAGTHRISVSLPADKISITKEVTLAEGKENRLALEPVYGRVMEKQRPSATRTTSFREGIRTILMTLNGGRI